MTRHAIAAAALCAVMLAARPSAAQLLAVKEGPVIYGHHHLASSNIEASKKFFADTLGGTAMKFAGNNADIVKYPNVLIFFRAQPPTGGTKGTTMNHIGFSVPNLRPLVEKIKANGYRMITRTEVAANQAVTDDIAVVNPDVSIAFALGPDDVKVELVEVRTQAAPIALHHVHFFNPKNTEMRDWYVKVFGATPRETPNFAAADLPRVALNFTASPEPVVGTKGRALDHIGFEIRNLEAFCRQLESMGITLDVPYRSAPQLNLSIAFITDPWGTSIELTEGLDKVQ